MPPLEEARNNPLLARRSGFSLHAATVCETHQRSRLERLCLCITRPPIATKRLSVDTRGRVVYRYKQPFRDGSLRVIACIEDPPLIAKILGHVQRREALVGRAARGPPETLQLLNLT